MARKIVAVRAVLFALLSLAAAPIGSQRAGLAVQHAGGDRLCGCDLAPRVQPHALRPRARRDDHLRRSSGRRTCSAPKRVPAVPPASTSSSRVASSAMRPCAAACPRVLEQDAPSPSCTRRRTGRRCCLPDEHRRLRLEREQRGQRHHRRRRQPGGFAFTDSQGNPIDTCGCPTTTSTTTAPTTTSTTTATTTTSTTTGTRRPRPRHDDVDHHQQRRPRRPPPRRRPPPARRRPRPRAPRRRPPPAPRPRLRRPLRRPPSPSRSRRCTSTATRCAAPTCRSPSLL